MFARTHETRQTGTSQIPNFLINLLNLFDVMKKIIYVISLSIMMVSCGAKKSVAPAPATSNLQEQEVIVPCAEYLSDKEALRAVASADAPNMQIAKDKAAVSARANLATTAQSFVQRVTERYAASYDVNEVATSDSRYQDLTRQLAAKMLQNSTVICDKLTKSQTPDGKTMYHAYVAVELSREDVLKDVEQVITAEISKDEKSRIDLDVEKFRAIFEQEFGK